MPSPRFLLGLGTVLVVCVGVAVLGTRFGDPHPSRTTASVTVTCLGGSEKTELMADQKIKNILRDKYHVVVNFAPLGSYDLVRLSTADLKSRNVDCLWPSSASAQSVFENSHSGAYKDYSAENVLQSPEVVYAGPRGTDALVKAGVVAQRDNRYFIVDVKTLLLDYVLKRKTWEQVGASGLSGPVTIASTDPAKSNSGFTMAQLELSVVATDNVYQAPTLEQARKALPTMRALYEAQGLQSRSSDSGFRQWLTQGAELHAPLYAGYENQLIQQVTQGGTNATSLMASVRVLYPEPTVYSDHPILALDANAARFVQAMKDPQIQSLAWSSYGFRSAVQVGANNVADFKNLPLADQVRTTPPPAADVTLALLACVTDAKTCQ
jgi:hypothetical protein